MDSNRFDRVVRSWASSTSRRTIVGGLIGSALGLAGLAESDARKKRTHRKAAKKRTATEAEPCWRAGACIVSKGSNVSQCDLTGYTAPDPLDCTRCNLSRTNLRGADLTGVNLTRANLSGACLVNADLTGAVVTNTTNLYNAIFCNTRMPDGSINNSGCGAGTACCPTPAICEPDCGIGRRCLECTLRAGTGCGDRSFDSCASDGTFGYDDDFWAPGCTPPIFIGVGAAPCASAQTCAPDGACPAGQECVWIPCCNEAKCLL